MLWLDWSDPFLLDGEVEHSRFQHEKWLWIFLADNLIWPCRHWGHPLWFFSFSDFLKILHLELLPTMFSPKHPKIELLQVTSRSSRIFEPKMAGYYYFDYRPSMTLSQGSSRLIITTFISTWLLLLPLSPPGYYYYLYHYLVIITAFTTCNY